MVKTSKASLDSFLFMISKDKTEYIFLIREKMKLCYKN